MNHHRTLILPRLLLGIFLLLPALFQPGQPAQAAALWYVSPNGSDFNTCSSPASPCHTLSHVVRQASMGSTIRAASGTYTADNIEAIVQVGKNLTLSGGWNADFSAQTGYAVIEEAEDPYNRVKFGIYVGEFVNATVERFVVQNMSLGNDGSAIYNRGYLTLKDSYIVNNNATLTSYSEAVAIRNDWDIKITGCTIAHNLDGWIIINSVNATMLIENSRISENSGTFGAGIYNRNSATLTIKTSQVTQNTFSTSTSKGGGIYNYGTLNLIESEVSANQAQMFGGGIYNEGTATLTSSTIHDNHTPGQGGGIYNLGTLTLQETLVLNNTSDGNGGGIYNAGAARVNNSTLRLNSSLASGGAVANALNLELANSTLNANTSGAAGGGAYNQTTTTEPAVLEVSNTTLDHNTGGANGGVANQAGVVRLRNSLVAENTAPASPDCLGTITSAGYNLVANPAGCGFTAGAGDLLSTDPQLSRLVEWLGYNPLQAGSPAIDAGDPAGCTDSAGQPLPSDQRGAARQGRCDIGAYEYTTPGAPAEIFIIQGYPQKVRVNAEFSLPLQGLVLDAARSPIPGLTLTFTAPAAGASASFLPGGGNSTEATTDSHGMIGPLRLAANGQTGDYTVVASTAGDPFTANFAFTNQVITFLPGTFKVLCDDFSDNFSSPSSGWPVGEDSYLRTNYINGEYSLFMKQGGYTYLLGAPTCLRNDFTVSVDARWIEIGASSYSLVFGMQNNFSRFYLLEVSTGNRVYSLLRVDGDSVVEIQPRTENYSAIQYGQNNMKVARQGSSITVWINNKKVGAWQDDGIRGISAVGIAATTYQNFKEIRFDNFTVAQIKPATLPGLAAPSACAAPLATAPAGGLEITRLPAFGAFGRLAPALLKLPAGER